jgi:hypothetical protein
LALTPYCRIVGPSSSSARGKWEPQEREKNVAFFLHGRSGEEKQQTDMLEGRKEERKKERKKESYQPNTSPAPSLVETDDSIFSIPFV